MHRLAGALGQPLQMGLGHLHDGHIVDDTAGKFKHLQRQAIPPRGLLLGDIPQPHQTGQQPVHRALGQVGALGQRLQAGPRRVGRQQLDQRKDPLHTLYAAFFRHKIALFPKKINKIFTFSAFAPFGRGRSVSRNDYNKDWPHLQALMPDCGIPAGCDGNYWPIMVHFARLTAAIPPDIMILNQYAGMRRAHRRHRAPNQ